MMYFALSISESVYHHSRKMKVAEPFYDKLCITSRKERQFNV